MKEKLNLVEILKDAPKGTKLYSPICGECELNRIDKLGPNYFVCLIVDENFTLSFDAKGRYHGFSGECMLFPSKDNRDWSTFKVPQKYKHFEPFQKVLYYGYKVWAADFYSHYNEATCEHFLVSGFIVSDNEILPYEGNEDKLGKPVK